MTGLRRALGLVAIEGIVVGLVALAIVLSSDHSRATAASTAALGLFVGWSFIGVGLFAWWRRPDSRFGVLMAAVGFAWFLGVLTAADASWLFTLGVLLLEPVRGRLRAHAAGVSRRPDRLAAAAQGARRPATRCRSSARCRRCCSPTRGPRLRDARRRRSSSATTTRSSGSSTRSRRCSPSSSSATCSTSSSSAGSGHAAAAARDGARAVVRHRLLVAARRLAELDGRRRARRAPDSTRACSASSSSRSTPYGFLFGLLRSRVVQAGAVSELLRRMGDGPDGAGCASCSSDALGDRSLQVVYWLEDGAAGSTPPAAPSSCPPRTTRARLPRRSSARAAASARSCTTARCATTPSCSPPSRPPPGLAIENERLQAQLRARVEELRALARPDRRGRHGRAPAARAQPARRRPAAARRALADACASPRAACTRTPTRAEQLLGGAQEELAPRARGAARAGARHPSRRALGPRAAPRRSRRSPAARRCPVELRRHAARAAARRRSRRRPTSSWPRR